MARGKDELDTPPIPPEEKNPRTLVIGRLRDLRGWKRRDEKRSEKTRREIALKGAMARWAKNRK